MPSQSPWMSQKNAPAYFQKYAQQLIDDLLQPTSVPDPLVTPPAKHKFINDWGVPHDQIHTLVNKPVDIVEDNEIVDLDEVVNYQTMTKHMTALLYHPEYLGKFTPIYLDWSYVGAGMAYKQRGVTSPPLICTQVLTSGKKIESTSLFLKCQDWKFAATDELPNHNCSFSVKVQEGARFMIGLTTCAEPKIAPFADNSTNGCLESQFSVAFGSNGTVWTSQVNDQNVKKDEQMRYGKKYGKDSIVTVYFDREKELVFFGVGTSKFGTAASLKAPLTQSAGIDGDGNGRKLYGAIACLSQGDCFEVVQPEMED